MKKGDIVRLNRDICFTSKSGGKREFPLSNHNEDINTIVIARRPITEEEVEHWRESDWSKGMNDAGESKLPPRSVSVEIHADRKYIVERARCRASLHYGNPTPGLAKIICTNTGETAYIKRTLIEVVS